ncbi:hypothetical protein [Citrobacter koseri]|uniref:hypothetical protein n=1 Tax=Citrobacter koseri TaxID=545 RepID=UPI000D99808F|nr:hypothetical protein [Citrobacter koseri]EKX8767623.1 hypothetical protein [Citrobacter koseri]MBJ9646912.1 hypothetical protein [Citrobacter koseri]SQB09579.1 Uncharacterised protein [Citrobacter koseri]
MITRKSLLYGVSISVLSLTCASFAYNSLFKQKDALLIIGYGQSLMTGMEGWPALSNKEIVDNAFMIGESVRPTERHSAFYRTNGSGFRTISSVVQNPDKPSEIYNHNDVSILKRNSLAEGEEPIVPAVKILAKEHKNSFFVGMNAGASGADIKQLSKKDLHGYYNRYLDAVSIFNSNAVDVGLVPKVMSIVFMQGEMNYMPPYSGAPTTQEDYGRYLQNLYEDMEKDAVNVTGQKNPPFFFMYQTTGAYTSDKNNLSVGMAQLGFSNKNKNVFMVGPTYQYPDKGNDINNDAHLDPNGYRWFGVQLAKVMHKVIDENINWSPLQPISTSLLDGKIIIKYLVPSPPLQFMGSYDRYSLVMHKDKGFTLYDGSGRVDISSVEITSPDEITITPARRINGTAKLFYADKTYHNGNGNVADSDSTVSPLNYEYTEGNGQFPESNIKELVGKPYPLNNFSVAFYSSVGE